MGASNGAVESIAGGQLIINFGLQDRLDAEIASAQGRNYPADMLGDVPQDVDHDPRSIGLRTAAAHIGAFIGRVQRLI